jgi:diaminohydroxyphosphoribosylaminopyrimidine deaminase/5-amino-6-(5-phosphoribosylamino)uracil reductase
MENLHQKSLNKDEEFIRLCFSLARKGLGYTSPNPIVGAVLVVPRLNNKIIGQGYHTAYGKPHAEIEAINDAIRNGYKDLLKEAVLYVNLEPCCHYGKTPPCVDKIIEVGIKKVVCSMYDVNPVVRKKGIKKLVDAGVDCKVGVLEKEAKELNKFYIKWMTKKLPYVTVKVACSLDGKIATYTGDSKWISSKKSRDYVHKLRTIYDAVLVGINTVKIDNPYLTSHNKDRNPIRVIVGDVSKLSLFKKYNVFNNETKTIVFTKKSKKTKFFEKIDNITIYQYKVSDITFKEILSTLAEKHLTSSILVEGGAETITKLIEENLVDDLMVFLAPKIIGGKNAKTWVEGKGVRYVKDAYKLKIERIEIIDQDLVLTTKMLT